MTLGALAVPPALAANASTVPLRLCTASLVVPKIVTGEFSEPVVVAARVGYLGGRRAKFTERMDKLFGARNWEFRHRVENELVPRSQALAMYEDGYYRHFLAQPDVLDDLVRRAKDVYDTAISNVESGFDYDKQETEHQHLQDIAVRRAVARLGRKFEGSEYLQIRGRDSTLYHLNPGRVPFGSPAIIVKPRLFEESWVKPDSVEDFWQNNKFLVIKAALLDGLQARTARTVKDGKGDQYKIVQQQLLPLLLATPSSSRPIPDPNAYFRRAGHAEAAEDLALDYVTTLDTSGLLQPAGLVAQRLTQLLELSTTVEPLVLTMNRLRRPEYRAAFALACIAQEAPTVGQDWMLASLAADSEASRALREDEALRQMARRLDLVGKASRYSFAAIDRERAMRVFANLPP